MSIIFENLKIGSMRRDAFFLIHGSWHGGWTWDPVGALLQRDGHRVSAPSLLGCAERAQLLTSRTTLDDIIADAITAVSALTEDKVVIVGHSSGAVVARAMAAEIPQKVSRLFLFDGLAIQRGECAFHAYPAEERQRRLNSIEPSVALTIPVPDPIPPLWGIDGTDHAWARKQLTPHPLAFFTTPWTAQSTTDPVVPIYVSCNAPAHPILERSKDLIKSAPHRWIDLPLPHDGMLVDPGMVASVLKSF